MRREEEKEKELNDVKVPSNNKQELKPETGKVEEEEKKGGE